MNGVTQAAERWQDADEEVAPWAAVQMAFPDEPATPRVGVLPVVMAAAGLAWTAWLAWLAQPADPAAATRVIVDASPVLALLGIAYLLMARGGRAEVARVTTMRRALDEEVARLDGLLGSIEARLRIAGTRLGETTNAIGLIGTRAGTQLDGVNTALEGEVGRLGGHADKLHRVVAAARADVAMLLNDLPRTETQARRLVKDLSDAGAIAREQAGELETRITALTAAADTAKGALGQASVRLNDEVTRLAEETGAMTHHVVESSQRATAALDSTIMRLADAQDTARIGVDAHSGALLAIVDQARATLATTGHDAAASIARHTGEAGERVSAMAALLDVQAQGVDAMLVALEARLAAVDQRLAALDDGGVARATQLDAALDQVVQRTDGLDAALMRTGGTADTLMAQTDRLMSTLDGVTREVGEALPAALAAVDQHIADTRSGVAGVAPELASVATTAAELRAAVADGATALATQRDTLAAMQRAVADVEGATRALGAELAATDSAAQTLAQGTSAQLIDALIRVRETASASADRARDAIDAVIPVAAQRLADAARAALLRSTESGVEARIAAMADAADQAAARADRAAEQLSLRIADMDARGAEVETRLASLHDALQDDARDGFARRVSGLIEALNSTAINVTRILSHDVTDMAWEAYLRGDRGVFTRRAVRLLDTTEARAIAKRHEEDAAFRDEVNRYVHDFEAVLRSTLATRDGSLVAVTLLSSDMGKLYVALAQAIERLR